MLITVTSYSQIWSFTGIFLLHKTRLIIANAPIAWGICCWMLRSSFNEGVTMVLTYLSLLQYEKNSFSFINISAVFIAVAVFPGRQKKIASIFEFPSFCLSPQWTVKSPDLVKHDYLISFKAASIPFLDKKR